MDPTLPNVGDAVVEVSALREVAPPLEMRKNRRPRSEEEERQYIRILCK